MNCWRKEKSKSDPYFGLNDRLIEQVFHSDVGFGGLTEDERVVFSIRELVIEVGNGGFHQYFYNSSGARHSAAETALERLNEEESLELLRRARHALFPGGEIPSDTAERREMMPKPESKSGDLEGARLAKLGNALDSRLMRFAKDAGLADFGSHPDKR